MKKGFIFSVLFPLGVFAQQKINALEAAYQLTQTKAQLPQLEEDKRYNVPLEQRVVFKTVPFHDAFPITPPFFCVYSQMTPDAGNCKEIYWKGLDYEFLQKQVVTPFYLGKDTVFQFSIRSKMDVEEFNRFRFYSCKREEVQAGSEKATFFKEFIYYGKNAAEVEKDRQAILALTEIYLEAMSHRNDSPTPAVRLLYVLNRTVGTQEYHRDDMGSASWHTWKIEQDTLVAEIFSTNDLYQYKCSFKARMIKIPLRGVLSFSEDENGFIQVVLKENQVATIFNRSDYKANCQLNPWKNSSVHTSRENKIKLAANWFGHAGMTLDDINAWIQTYQK